jgi:indolepyruvate ferredoxin oxidoreductase
MTLHDVSLADKFDLGKERIFVSGSQAIVRMLLMQRERDRRAGLSTAGFVSGYRGSPVGGLDNQLWKAGKELSAAGIVFQPGLNEELAATACIGSQQAELLGEARYDGVFALWYGKGPGVDRSGDMFRHGNLAGTSRHGGVLALMGDDHLAESSSAAHASEFAFVDAMIPILNPAGVQELIDFGLYGYALSRFAGTWVGIKCVKDNIESTVSVDAALDRINIVLPEIDLPPGGLNIRYEVNALGQEVRMHDHKRAAVAAFIQANRLNRLVFSGGSSARLGIVTTGTGYLDVRQALDHLGIDEVRASSMGIRLLKVACPWPFDLEHMADFTRGLELVIVVEEKRSLIETQMREHLYGMPGRPVIVGKKDERGQPLFRATGALDINEIAIAIGERILAVIGPSEEIASRVARLRSAQLQLAEVTDIAGRAPHFCPGCPHNTSTRLPEGSIAGGGIGCHFMAMWMDRGTIGFTPMGGEGAQWIGQAPFSKREHYFQNLGDGTYSHSGSLALRFAIAAGVNMTYKILFNHAVAMTGGQPVEGQLTVAALAEQIRAEGVSRIAVVSDDPEKHVGGPLFPGGTTVHHRDELDAVQRELREVKGVSVLIYDQACATEARRRRKRGTLPDTNRRVIINELVCEGCGDCGVASNCVSVQPVETEFGRKRRIDQSSCNKDLSCVNGFCPSFVTVHGAKLKTPGSAAGELNPLDGVPAPELPRLESTWSAIVDGVGGTGVITIGAVIGMAAHLEGKGAGIIDMAGLAQKGGAVHSHLRIARSPADLTSLHVAAGSADLVLGCDLVVSGGRKVLSTVKRNHTLVVANTAEVMPGEFTRSADFTLPTERLKQKIQKAAGEDKTRFFNVTEASSALLGDAIYANILLLGMAYQLGGLPVSAEAIEKAIELNGEAAARNILAFRWGRRAAFEPDFVRDLVARSRPRIRPAPATDLDHLILRRVEFLTAYQNTAYADRYRNRIAKLRAVEARTFPGSTAVTEAAARNLFKLMAVKDEYEVARLYSEGGFQRQLAEEFDGFERLEFHLAPPILALKNKSGQPRKVRFGPWMMGLFGLLHRLKGLRGSVLDPFAYTVDRRLDRQLLAQYEADLHRMERLLIAGDISAAQRLASIPSQIRGFGHVRAASARKAADEHDRLVAELDRSRRVSPLAPPGADTTGSAQHESARRPAA